MPWNVEYNSQLGIIQGQYVGRVTDGDFIKATAKALSLSKANKTNRFLIDDSRWEGGTSTFGLYDLPKLFQEQGFERGSKAALILPPAGTPEENDARFFETVCVNSGWQVEVFNDRQKAIDWLTSR